MRLASTRMPDISSCYLGLFFFDSQAPFKCQNRTPKCVSRSHCRSSKMWEQHIQVKSSVRLRVCAGVCAACVGSVCTHSFLFPRMTCAGQPRLPGGAAARVWTRAPDCRKKRRPGNTSATRPFDKSCRGRAFCLLRMKY